MIELLVVLTIMILLGGLLLPALTRSKVKAAKAGCASNMKQVTLAFIVWVNDREKDVLPWRVDVADGGTRNHPSGLQNNAWFQYSWISNELPNPRVLACPSDRQAKPADTFDAAPDGGFLSPAYKNEACSYNLGLEGGSRRESSTALPLVPDAEADHEDLLISDRNSNTRPAANGSCSSGLESIHQLTTGDSQWLRQPNYGHGIVGNVALCDGSVLLTRQTELNQLIAKSARENSAVHWLQPRPSP